MAIVKVLFRKNAERVIRYVFEHTQAGDHVDSENCPPYAQGASEEFEVVRNQHHFKEGNNQAVHIIQSWDEEDSRKLTPKQVNEMGKKLVGDYFKGHQFAIVTHSETGKLHNHIVVNTVNMETGKSIEPKFKHLHKLREINDGICLERGLKIPNKEAHLRRANVPQKVQQMVRAGRESWVWDVRNKADVARHLATSHDEYVGYLDTLGIKARVEDKNITYFYPGRSRGKRGDKLGKPYDKHGLEEQYRNNDERFKSRPEIRANLWSAYSTLAQSPGQYLASSKDYSHFTKIGRNSTTSKSDPKRELSRGIIPADEIRKARGSILDYCKENKIALSSNTKGQTVLRDREYIVIDGAEAKNTRNGTRATLIDFVASHQKISLLHAVAKINNNPSLLAFEQNFGEVKRKFTSFYIPKPDQMPLVKATEHLGRFLRSNGANSKAADALIKHQRAEVSKDGVIRLFAGSDSGGTIEFTESKDQTWDERKQGKFQQPFFKRPGRSNRLFIYTDPKQYLSGRGKDLLSERPHRDGLLALMEPDVAHVEHHLTNNKNIRSIHVVTPKNKSLSKGEIDFFGVLKQKFNPLGIEVNAISHDKALSHEGPDLSL